MRSRIWLIVLLVLVVLLAGGWWWWKSPKSAPAKQRVAEKLTPKVTVGRMNITDIDAGKVKLTSKVTISNPLPVDLNAHKLQYEIFIDSMKVLQDDYAKPISVKSKDSTTIDLPMELLAEPMARILKYFDKHDTDSANYTIKTHFVLDVPIAGDRNFNVEFSKKLPAVRVPKIKVTNVDLNVLKMKKKGVDIEVMAYNPNQFPIRMKDCTFQFSIEDDLKMDGSLEKIIHIPARGSQSISMHANLREGKVLKVGWDMLTKSKETHFQYKFQGKLVSDNKMLDNSKMATTVDGSLNEMMKAVKKIKQADNAMRE